MLFFLQVEEASGMRAGLYRFGVGAHGDDVVINSIKIRGDAYTLLQ